MECWVLSMALKACPQFQYLMCTHQVEFPKTRSKLKICSKWLYRNICLQMYLVSYTLILPYVMKGRVIEQKIKLCFYDLIRHAVR